jgi:heme-degrading monooxygenase HmoA
MFARSVSMRLKANLLAELTRKIEDEILPLLRKQAGFQGDITLAVPGGTEAVIISVWDKKENAEAYSREPNPQLRKILEKFIEGTPAIQTYEVAHSTFHPVMAQTAAQT